MMGLAAAAVAVGLGAGGEPPVVQPPGELPRAEVPEVRMTWSVPRRFDGAWSAWNGRTYDRDYVHPRAWTVTISLCGSRGGGSEIRRYEVRLRGEGYRRGAGGPSCRFRFRDLPRPGAYDVEATLRLEDGRVARHDERIVVRDWLVASLGDSMASGEGNPERPGRYSFDVDARRSPDWLWKARLGLDEHRRVQWKDRRCHRSARGGHALFARDLEAGDPHSSVTFVSLACSGAQLTEGLLEPYAGQEPPEPGGRARDHRPLAPQVDVLDALAGGRTVDALLLSAGVNDLGFSTIVERCATNLVVHGSGRGCVIGVAAARMPAVAGRYDRLGAALRDRLEVAEVYVSDYPADPFAGGGCGLLGAPGFGVRRSEARWMALFGRRLNREIELAAARNGWSFVPGMTAGFEGRAYCDRPSNLVSVEESLRRQGNVDGAVHPNRLGHRVLRRMLGDAVVLGRSGGTHRRVTIEIEEVFLGSVPRAEAASGSFEVTPRSGERRHPPQVARFDVPRRGEWIAPPGGTPTITLDVYDPPRAPRYATAFEVLARGGGGLAGRLHTGPDGLQPGRHEIRDVNDRLGVRYRVGVRLVSDPPMVEPPGGDGPVAERPPARRAAAGGRDPLVR